MFDTIHWNEFLLTVALLLGGYYVFMIFSFYRKELIFWVNRLTSKDDTPYGIQTKQGHIQQSGTSTYRSESEATTHDPSRLMGKIKPEKLPESEHVMLTDAEQLAFSASEEEKQSPKPQNTQSSETLLIGTIADLLEETKTLVQMIQECDGTQEESISLFQALFSRYTRLADTRFREAINLYIQDLCKEQCAFELTVKEINSWWPHDKTEKHSSSKIQ